MALFSRVPSVIYGKGSCGAKTHAWCRGGRVKLFLGIDRAGNGEAINRDEDVRLDSYSYIFVANRSLSAQLLVR